MLAYDLPHWLTFFTAAVILNIAPGPDMAFILGHTARGGRVNGFAAMFGIWAGALCHVIFAVVGLSALIAASAFAFTVIKWVGVAYLFWLAIQAFRSDGGVFAADDRQPPQRPWSIFRRGVLIDLLNPKVAIFFLAFLPQFVRPEAGPPWLQIFLHGVLVIFVGAIVEPPLILLGDRLTRRVRASQRLGLWLERALGTMLAGLGIKLAFTER